jgi:hypothetical protein
MSIEKIIERIRMIEENDFNIINEAISGSETEITPLFNPKDSLMGKIKTKFGFNDRDQAALSAIAKVDKNSRDIQSTVDNVLRSGTRVNIGDNVEIPKEDINTIIKIYKAINNKNIKISDLDINYKAKSGYMKTGDNKNILTLRKRDLIQIYYDNENLTNLKGLSIFNKNNVFNSQDFINAFNELNNNKRNYLIKQVTLNNKEIKIIF